MKSNKYDEYQLQIRYKTSTHCFIMTLFLIFLSAIINERHIWAEPTAEAIVICFIPLTYFITITTIKGAYNSFSHKRQGFDVIFFACFALLWIFQLFTYKTSLVLIENARLTNDIAKLLSPAFFAYITIINLIKFLKDKKQA